MLAQVMEADNTSQLVDGGQSISWQLVEVSLTSLLSNLFINVVYF